MTWLPPRSVAILLTIGLGRTEIDAISPLDLADVTAYLRAFETDPDAPAVPVDRVGLLERPGVWKGRRVEVAGRIARRFTQGAWGDLPALAEVWIVDARQGPLCLIHPLDAPPGGNGSSPPAPRRGDWVTFRGISIRPLRYGATADGRQRVAPLLAGPASPVPSARPGGETVPPGLDFAAQRRIMDWGLTILLGSLALMMLLRVRLSTPTATLRRRQRRRAARARQAGAEAAPAPDPDDPFAPPHDVPNDHALPQADDPNRRPPA